LKWPPPIPYKQESPRTTVFIPNREQNGFHKNHREEEEVEESTAMSKKQMMSGDDSSSTDDLSSLEEETIRWAHSNDGDTTDSENDSIGNVGDTSTMRAIETMRVTGEMINSLMRHSIS
jgi:hypothetical protein